MNSNKYESLVAALALATLCLYLVSMCVLFALGLISALADLLGIRF